MPPRLRLLDWRPGFESREDCDRGYRPDRGRRRSDDGRVSFITGEGEFGGLTPDCPAAPSPNDNRSNVMNPNGTSSPASRVEARRADAIEAPGRAEL